MDYKYIIQEIHTNSEKDPSPVILHDAYTSETVTYDGNDLVFLLKDGIIVRPDCAPNETDRYLQTDAAELRLRNVTKISVRNGVDFPCVGEQFTILHHKYRTDKGVFQMELINKRRHGELYFDFTCGGVEYRFSRFTGDSWLQQAKDHKHETFRRFLRQGRGEAVHMLRRMDDVRRHEYVEMVAHAACSDLRFDHQCNADRTQYIFDLLESFDGEDRETLNRTIIHDNWREAAENSGVFELDQYIHVLKRFIENGEPAAEETVRLMYETIRDAYESRTEVPEKFDLLGQKYRWISRFVGKTLADDDEDCHVPNPRHAEPPLTMERIIKKMRNPNGKTVHPSSFHNFFRTKVTPADIGHLAAAARNESDPDAKARLYSLFSEANYPLEPDELIAVARTYEPMLYAQYGPVRVTAFKLQVALTRLRHPAVRAYGFELLERAAERPDNRRFIYGFKLWAANYDEETDLDRFTEFLTNFPEVYEDENIRHSIEFTIVHDMFTRKYEDPRTYGHLVWVYENTYCSCCRRHAVEILAAHGILQKRIRKQCLFDCDPMTRSIAENASAI